MKRIILVSIIALLAVGASTAQATEKKETSYDQFISQSGKIIRFQDYKLPSLKGSYSLYECKVRVLTAGEKTTYYFQVSVKGKYSDVVGSVEENDLVEMAKALETLMVSFTQDKKSTSDYLENKYITNDGVKLGYYISKTDSAWYLDLDKYKSDSTAFLKDGETIMAAIKLAQDKIASLKK